LSFTKTAILVDLGFFIKRVRTLCRNELSQLTSADEEAIFLSDILFNHIKNHLTFKKEKHELYRIYVYDAPPLKKKMHHPKTGHAIDFSKSKTSQIREALHQSIRQHPMTALRLGTLHETEAVWTLKDKKLYKRFIQGKVSYESLQEEDFTIDVTQKQVDMKIGMDITWLSLKQLVGRIILIAGDSDFVPVAKLARKEGITFILDPMRQDIRPDLSEHIDLLRSPSLQTTLQTKEVL